MLFSHILGLWFGFAGIINAQVDLGTAESFAILAGSTVTNTGNSDISGDIGVFPGTEITGIPPGEITNGVRHEGDAVAAQAQQDVTAAYVAAAGQPAMEDLAAELGGLTLPAGVYRFSTIAQLTGDLTLDGEGVSDGVWIFQIGSTLTTASAASVILINGALPCNIFWQVGSSATIGTDTTFVGNVLALTSITMNTGASSNGGLYAQNGAVTLDDNDVTGDSCSPITTTTTPPTTSTTTGTEETTTTTGMEETTTTTGMEETTTTTSAEETTTTTGIEETTTTTGMEETTTTTSAEETTTTTGIEETTTTTSAEETTTTTSTEETTTTDTGSTTITTGTEETTATDTGSTTTTTSSGSTTTTTTTKSTTITITPIPRTTMTAPTYTSTFNTTRTYTITSCAPAVINCSVGHVTTETITCSATCCPGETEKPTVLATATTLRIKATYSIPAPVCTKSACLHATPAVTVDAARMDATTVSVQGCHGCAHASETLITMPTATYPAITAADNVSGLSTITTPCRTCGPSTESAPVTAGAAETYQVSTAAIIAAAFAVAVIGT